MYIQDANTMDLTPKDRKFLDQSLDALLAFWQLRGEVPGTLPVVFMLIARNPGIRPTELAEKSGYPHTNISKLLLILINELELVQMEFDPTDRRSRHYSLTATGEKFLRKILPA